MTDPVISLEGVGKRYLQYREESMLLKRLLQPHKRRRPEEFWALKDLGFELEPGGTLGIIGRNGSGKTTLLRLLSGVSAPTTGHLRVVGRIAPLIGVGVGFSGELTGRENVLVNGRLLGMSRAEVTRKFDDIVDFSEMSRFIDTPVKYYSSGMFLRLAFSVAIHTDPDIFLLDEILAVGDAAFQLKCTDRLNEIRQRGATIVIVTHSLELLDRMAPRALVLDRGNIEYDGDTESAIGTYQEVMQRQYDRDEEETRLRGEGGFTGTGRVHVELLGVDGRPRQQFESGDDIVVSVSAVFDADVVDPNLGLMVALPGRGGVFNMTTQPGEYRGAHGPGRPLEASVQLDNRLLAGTYVLVVAVIDRHGALQIGVSQQITFHITSRARGRGVVDLAPRVMMGGVPVVLADAERLG